MACSSDESSDFTKMTVTEIKKFLVDRGVTVNGYNKAALAEIASAVQKMKLPSIHNVHDKVCKENEDELFIDDMQISNPFKMNNLVNNFIDSPPFGLYDIFNFLICHSTSYDKQGLAAYKSFDEYRLFEDGYVESLMTKTLTNERVHVYVGKVRPAMKTSTDDGKNCYDLWFILEGKGTNRGCVLKAKCMCKGGRDGGCKHIGAAMYSLEEVLNTRGENSSTSGSCLWSKKPQASTKPCDVSDLVIEKTKLPSSKLKKRSHTYAQNISVDVRSPNERSEPNQKKLSKLTQQMMNLKTQPAILPLFRKLYYKKSRKPRLKSPLKFRKKESCEEEGSPNVGILFRKLFTFIEDHPECTPEEAFKLLRFTEEEIMVVSDATQQQWQSKEWYIQKAGFITASKCKQVFTRQATIEKNQAVGKSTDVTCTVNQIVYPNVPAETGPINHEPQNSREWGLVHEETARKAYYRVERHNHHKLQLLSKGFLISAKKSFLGASLDNIRRCDCSTGCQDVVVEYKCPWKHKDEHPKNAFLSKEVGGVQKNSILSLLPSSPYYFQVQTQLYVSNLTRCDLVIWTNQGIYTNCVEFDSVFMENVCGKLELFWMKNVLPVMMAYVAESLSGMYVTPFFYVFVDSHIYV